MLVLNGAEIKAKRAPLEFGVQLTNQVFAAVERLMKNTGQITKSTNRFFLSKFSRNLFLFFGQICKYMCNISEKVGLSIYSTSTICKMYTNLLLLVHFIQIHNSNDGHLEQSTKSQHM